MVKVEALSDFGGYVLALKRGLAVERHSGRCEPQIMSRSLKMLTQAVSTSSKGSN